MTHEGSSSLHPVDQACAIPFRWRQKSLEFCLITTRRTGRWGFPKGQIEVDDTEQETALKEAYEEAGVSGQIIGDSLGAYAHRKKRVLLLDVAVYLMQVEQCDDTWPEKHLRQRRWVSAKKALSMIDQKTLRQFLHQAIDRILQDSAVPVSGE